MRKTLRLVAVLAAAVVPLVGIVGLSAGPASACGKLCTAGKPKSPSIVVTASPNPVIETGPSNIVIIVQVETKDYIGPIVISSTELFSNCVDVAFATLLAGTEADGFPTPTNDTTDGTITVDTDNDGNATVVIGGSDCSPGENVIEASESTIPFHTATTRLIIDSPMVTASGVKGYPADEVETGDGAGTAGPVGTSDVYAVFYVEAPAVYAEDTESITSDELTARCGEGSVWVGAYLPATALAGDDVGTVGLVAGSSPGSADPAAGQLIDDDGNVAYLFAGASCAAGVSTVIAAVTDGPTYRTTYKILPPAVTV
jgi:hypothetical protein